MSGLLTAFTTGVTAFCATNIDDLVILLWLFSQKNQLLRYQQVLFGQYIGFTLLVIASIPGFFGGLFIPQYWIGLLGLIPIIIGFDCLLNKKKDELVEIEFSRQVTANSALTNLISPQTFAVTALTFANGTDNISVYVPLFAHSSLTSLIVILSIFFFLVGVWCYAAKKLTDNLSVVHLITVYSNTLIAFLLIGLGVFIVLDSQALSLIKLFLSCSCLVVLVKKEPENEELIS